jgi:aryl-alcohol dehydrogenase-like predicted oxidoreductase
MDYTTLGRTGLKVSVAGLECGGNSCLGQSAGKSIEYSVGIIRRALDLGVNFIDTARHYGTEEVISALLQQTPRDSVILATKAHSRKGDVLLPPEDIVRSLDQSLKAMGTDYIDVFQLHSVLDYMYDHVRDNIVPALLREREKGKFRFLGMTELPPADHKHLGMQRAVDDDVWDTLMFAFNLMSQNARSLLLPKTQKNNIGVLGMFAVRSIFSTAGRIEEELEKLAAAGKIPAELAAEKPALRFLFEKGGADTIIEAAYRYARYEPGIDVVMFGTGNPDHVDANINSILKPALPAAMTVRLEELFGELEGVGLDRPNRAVPT